MKVKEVSQLTGVSVRTLHHYDDIGLLTPNCTTEAGYRLYSDDNLATLQQILFFRELGFSLKKSKNCLRVLHLVGRKLLKCSVKCSMKSASSLIV